MRKESKFQTDLIKDIERVLPGAMVLKNDAGYIQGIPDLTILYKDRWAALECKRSENSAQQPNQEYYVERLDEMSYAAFVHPGNNEAILNDLQLTLGASRPTCVP